MDHNGILKCHNCNSQLAYKKPSFAKYYTLFSLFFIILIFFELIAIKYIIAVIGGNLVMTGYLFFEELEKYQPSKIKIILNKFLDDLKTPKYNLNKFLDNLRSPNSNK